MINVIKVIRCYVMVLTGNDLASGERIARVSGRTIANGIVADNPAFGLFAAHTGTRIDALAIEASLN